MAEAVDRGVTAQWPSGARLGWGIATLGLLFAGVFMGATALGLLTDDTLAAVGDGSTRTPNTGQFIAVYLGTLVLGVAPALYLKHSYGIPVQRTTLVFFGVVFLWASTGRPWWLYGTIRRVRWFVLIQSEVAMRRLLALLGIALALAGALLSNTQYSS